MSVQGGDALRLLLTHSKVTRSLNSQSNKPPPEVYTTNPYIKTLYAPVHKLKHLPPGFGVLCQHQGFCYVMFELVFCYLMFELFSATWLSQYFVGWVWGAKDVGRG